ncbi:MULTISPECIES: GNAT family N-acetyltransferase [unclassified Paraflavitalea]|uniref:GNAT family N-acetyltransferase n=1 Tax=unclassified Paraflavitalea TaxID=2798305 RepID=UPI003D353654
MSTLNILRTNSDHPDFQYLVKALDRELAIIDGDEHEFFAQFNKTANLATVLVGYENNQPVAIGALRPYDSEVVEVKRMYVVDSLRGKGIASQVLAELEIWAAELGFKKCILETGKKQPDAIALYKKNGYAVIPNFGQYAEIDNSVCFEKTL